MVIDRGCLVCKEEVPAGEGFFVEEMEDGRVLELAIVCRWCNRGLTVGIPKRNRGSGRNVEVRRFNYRNREG